MTDADILYEIGDYWVCKAPKGKSGYEVYRNGVTHSRRCAIIVYEGAEGFCRAVAEADKRAAS